MYVEGVPVLKKGGVMVVVNPMPYKWTSPTHDAYKAIFEEAVAPLGPERFEAGLNFVYASSAARFVLRFV